MKFQHRGRGGPDDPTGRTGPDLYADVRPAPGIEFEEVIGSPPAPRPRAPRWTIVVLAVGAAAATMGLGGRLLDGSALGRNVDDRVVASPIGISTAEASAASTARVAVTPPVERVGLPLGFAAQSVSSGRAGQASLLVMGFVAQHQWVSIRLVDPDGATLANARVETRPPASDGTATGMQSFQATVEVGAGSGRDGPDTIALEISFSDDAGVGVVCTVPVGRPGVQARADAALLVLDEYARCA